MERLTFSPLRWLRRIIILLVVAAFFAAAIYGIIMITKTIPNKEERIANRIEKKDERVANRVGRFEKRFLDQKDLVSKKSGEYTEAADKHQALVDSLRNQESQQKAKINDFKDELQELIAPYKIKIASDDEVMKAINAILKEIYYVHDSDLQRLFELKHKEITEANDELLVMQKEHNELMKNSEDALNKQARKLAKAESKKLRLGRRLAVVDVKAYTDDKVREIVDFLLLKQAEVEKIQLEPYDLQGQLKQVEQKLDSLQAELDQMTTSRDKNRTGYNRACAQIADLKEQIDKLKTAPVTSVKVVVQPKVVKPEVKAVQSTVVKPEVKAVQPKVVEPVKTEVEVVPFITHLDEIGVIVPEGTVYVNGDATNWNRVSVKNGVAYIPAREGMRLLLNGRLSNGKYLDAFGVTLVAPNGDRLELNQNKARTTDDFGNPNLEYTYIDDKLSLVGK